MTKIKQSWINVAQNIKKLNSENLEGLKEEM